LPPTGQLIEPQTSPQAGPLVWPQAGRRSVQQAGPLIVPSAGPRSSPLAGRQILP